MSPGVTARSVLDTIRGVRGTRLESVAVLNEYHGADLPPGSRSVAFRLTFRDPERTLRDRDVDKAMTRVLRAVERQAGVVRRTTEDSAARG